MVYPGGSVSMTTMSEAVWLLRKQTMACLFGILLLILILGTSAVWPEDPVIARYDFLFVMAVGIQIALIVGGLETWEEAKVILVFHVVGTVMEIFKTHIGSWIYPEDNVLRLGGVPLFTGFMYAAIGSYLARTLRLFDARFTNYPPMIWTYLLSIAVYVNFFSLHYTADMRNVLFAAAILVFWRTWVHVTPGRFRVSVPLLAVFVGVACLIWVAENIGTYSGTWLYPNQREQWDWVSLSKIGSWFLLMLISWVLVTVIRPPEPET